MKRKMIFALALLPLFTVLLLPSSAGAWNASCLSWIIRGQPLSVIDYDEAFYNYDFTSEADAQNGNSAECDFPVTVLFTDNGEIWHVKDVYWGEATLHGLMYNKCEDGYMQAVDSDRGTRTNQWWLVSGTHMRLYARNGIYHHNSMIGDYCVATTHYDIFSWTTGLTCGWSEDAEQEIVQKAQDAGYTVYRDLYGLWNPEFFRTETGPSETHVWYSNGWASRVVLWP